jgi:hypothetical protein
MRQVESGDRWEVSAQRGVRRVSLVMMKSTSWWRGLPPERCAELGDEFFGAVAAIAEPTREVASET